MDFTIKTYKKLLTTLIEGGFSFQSFEGFLDKPGERVVVLRHDVDLRPKNSLFMAQLEHELGVSGTYYFRTVPESFDKVIIKSIFELGHEVGYHYENMHNVGKRLGRSPLKVITRELIDEAYKDFIINLEKFREIVPVKTISMHGSPRSRFNNLDIWKFHDYRNLGIIGEPYLDVDFSDVFYLTDTGRGWGGQNVNIRDRVNSGFKDPSLKFRNTFQIITAARKGLLPSRMMINVHPQRWTANWFYWSKELLWQNIKNQVKWLIVKKGSA